jgi:hypothetical protein
MKLRILAILSALTMIAALYMIFLFAPTEKTQGAAQRIFLHPCALAVTGAYGSAILLFVGCLGFLFTRISNGIGSRLAPPKWGWFSPQHSS